MSDIFAEVKKKVGNRNIEQGTQTYTLDLAEEDDELFASNMFGAKKNDFSIDSIIDDDSDNLDSLLGSKGFSATESLLQEAFKNEDFELDYEKKPRNLVDLNLDLDTMEELGIQDEEEDLVSDKSLDTDEEDK
jgi:hypothetical protein